jgi:hypothetical protein
MAASPAPPKKHAGLLKSADASKAEGRFVWSMLQSSDSRVYAERLRAVECPPAVIRRIIAEQLFEQRAEALAKVAPPPFWATPSERLAGLVKQFHEELAIIKRFDQIAWELAGIRCLERVPEVSDLIDYDFQSRILTDSADASEHDDFIALEHRLSWLVRRLDDLPCLSAYREHQNLFSWREAQFASLMNPGQQHEFKKRFAAFSIMFSSREHRFRFTGRELEEASERLAKGTQLANCLPGGKLLDSGWEPAISATLSSQRFAEYQRAADTDFRRLVENMGKDEPGVRERAQQFYQAKQPYDRAWIDALEDGSLSESQKADAIDQLRLEQTVLAREILGEKSFLKLTNDPPYWLYTDTEERSK